MPKVKVKQNLAKPINNKDIMTKTPSVIDKTPGAKTESIPQLGDPIGKRVSGIYMLLVNEVESNVKKYKYRLKDSKGREYRVVCKKFYKVGQIIPCLVLTIISKNGVKAKVISMGSKRRRRHNYTGTKHSSSFPSPCKGDHFHLIYTPMGNKL